MGFALLGIIIMVAGFIQYSSKWDDENCCQDSPPASCASTNCGGLLPVATMCAIPGNEDASFFIDDGCCYGVDSSGPNGLLFLWGGGAFAVVLLTLLIEECADKCCAQCGQRCIGCLLFIFNAIGIVFVVVLIAVLLGTEEAASGCDAKSVE